MNSNDKKVTFIGFGVLFLMILSALLFQGNATGGDDGGSRPSVGTLEGYTLSTETINFAGELAETASDENRLDLSGKLMKNISAVLTWSDEDSLSGRPRIRQYNNAPDEFSLSIMNFTGNTSEASSGANPPGADGMIEIIISIEDSVIIEQIDSGDQGEVWTVEVTMVNAGNWAPRIGIIGFTDAGNTYSLVVTYDYYDLVEIRGE